MIRTLPWLIHALLVTAALAAGPARAEPVRFDAFGLGLRFGTLLIDTEPGRVRATGEGAGLVGLILSARYDGVSEARPDGRRRFHSRSSRPGGSKEVVVAFRAGHPDRVDIEPASERTALSDPARVRDARIDPLAYLPELLRPSGPCPATGRLYDGRRLVRIRFGPAVPSGSGRECAGVYEIEAGPDHSIRAGRQFPLTLRYDGEGRLGEAVVRSGWLRVTVRRR